MSGESSSHVELLLFMAEIAKGGRASCRTCHKSCRQDELRIAKVVPNSDGKMKHWYHLDCVFEAFTKQRATTKRIESSRDISGFNALPEKCKVAIVNKIEESNNYFNHKNSTKKPKTIAGSNTSKIISEDCISISSDSGLKTESHKDNSFRQFRAVLMDLQEANSNTKKKKILEDNFTKGTDGKGFKGDKVLWCKFLLSSCDSKRKLLIPTKHLVKIFSSILKVTPDVLNSHLVHGDLGKTMQHFFELNKTIVPLEKSTLTLQEVDKFIEKINASKFTSDSNGDLMKHFQAFIYKCTPRDLKILLRLIKHNLKTNTSAEQVMNAIHPDAYHLYQESRDVISVFDSLKSASSSNSDAPVPKSNKKSSTKRKSDNDKTKSSSKKRKISEDISKSKITSRDDTNSDSPKSDIVKVKADVISTPPVIPSDASAPPSSSPTYFENVKLLLEKGVAETHPEWIKYFVNYGGTLCAESNAMEATHVVHLRDTIKEPTIICSASARHLMVEWIKNTVRNKSLQDWRPYTVRWNPSHGKV